MKGKTSKTKPTSQSKQPRLIFWVSLDILLFGLTFLTYYGYCWGWWGRDSLLMQYIFQCGCPLSSNESRYPDKIDVVIPACQNNSVVRLSPSGRLLFVGKEELLSDNNYILNLETGEKSYISALSEGAIHFLNDEIIFHTFYGIDEYLLDWTTGKQYPIQQFRDLRSDAYLNGDANPRALAESLRESKDIFLIGDDIVVALASDFHLSLKNNFFINRFGISGNSSNRVEEFLLVHNIPFIHIPDYPDYLPEVASPGGSFIARDDGIYLAGTNQKIINGYPGIEPFDSYNGKYFSLYGWTYDSTGVIYAESSGLCMIRFWLPFMDGSECLLSVPQPVLKLKVPQEYLQSSSP